MKGFVVVITSIIFVCFLSICGFAESDTYIIPYRNQPPVIDGLGDDAAWEGAELFVLDESRTGISRLTSAQDCSSTKISAIWSDHSSGKGLYFKFETTDSTFCYVMDAVSSSLNAMDCVQILIDPLNKKLTDRSTSFCFTFTPYSSFVGNGQFASGSAQWWEYWQWESGSCIETTSAVTDVMVACNPTSFYDDPNPDPYQNRDLIIESYLMEVFIPWNNMDISGEQVGDAAHDIVPGKTEFGLSFALVDYQYPPLPLYIPEPGEEKGVVDKDRDLVQMLVDFEDGISGFENASFYNRAILAYSNKELSESHYVRLQELIRQCDGLESSYFTKETFDNVFSKCTAAKAITELHSNEKIYSSYTDLLTAFESLKIKETGVGLKEALDEVRPVYEQGNILQDGKQSYTDLSWMNFVSAYDMAITFAEAPETPESTDALNKLLLYYYALQPKEEGVDLSALRSAIDESKQYDSSNYTEGSWDEMVELRNIAENYLRGTELDQGKIDTYEAQLKQSITDLKPVLPRTILVGAISLLVAVLFCFGIIGVSRRIYRKKEVKENNEIQKKW